MKVLNISFLINILIVLILLSSPCLLLNLVLNIFGVSSTLFQIFLLAMIIFVVFFVIKEYQFTIFQKRMQNYFILIIIYFLFVWNVDVIFSGSTRNVFRIIIYWPLLMILLNNRLFNINQFIKIFLFVSFILSSLSLIQYVGLPLGIIPVASASLVRSSLDGAFVGIGGVYTVVQETGLFGIAYRNQSFFSEPSNFAQFLMIAVEY